MPISKYIIVFDLTFYLTEEDHVVYIMFDYPLELLLGSMGKFFVVRFFDNSISLKL